MTNPETDNLTDSIENEQMEDTFWNFFNEIKDLCADGRLSHPYYTKDGQRVDLCYAYGDPCPTIGIYKMQDDADEKWYYYSLYQLTYDMKNETFEVVTRERNDVILLNDASDKIGLAATYDNAGAIKNRIDGLTPDELLQNIFPKFTRRLKEAKTYQGEQVEKQKQKRQDELRKAGDYAQRQSEKEADALLKEIEEGLA